MTDTLVIIKADCLHCIVHAVVKSYLEVHPKFTRDEVLSCLMAVIAEFMVAVSKDTEDLRTATEAFIQQVPDAMLIALESFPTSGRTQ